MSESYTATAYRAMVIAAIDESNATVGAEETFRSSAIAHALARVAGVEAKVIAAANREATADLKSDAPNGVAYTSGAAVGYHATAGDLFLLPLPASALSYRAVQTVVRLACDSVGTKAVRAMIADGTDQAATVVALETATTVARKAKAKADKADKARRETVATTDAGEGDESGEGETVARDAVLDALTVVSALLMDGAPLSDDARAMLSAIVDFARVEAPVAA